MPWYDGWFGSDAYNLVYDHRDENEAERLVDFVERAITPADEAQILDVGCGRGRHARAFARRGYQVAGIDLSESSIAEARTRAGAEGLDATFAQGDMRDPYCEHCMDGAVNLFTTFGYFEDDAENQRALQAVATALRPGGWLLQDFLNAPRVRATLTPESTRTAHGLTIHERRWVAEGRINKEITIEQNGTTDTFRESVRLFTLDDFRAMYDAVGLELVETYGTYDGDPYTKDSPRLLLHARTPTD